MIKYFLITLGLVCVAVVALFGFRGQPSTLPPIEVFPDMDRQQKVKSQTTSHFFADGKGDRLPVPGSVPVGYEIPRAPRQMQPEGIAETAPWSANPYSFSVGKDYFDTGLIGANYGDGIPITVSAELMTRGAERYGIYCAVCHGAAGDGQGVVAQYDGAKGLVASLHQDRLRTMPDGELFNTISHGKGKMMGYGSNLNLSDRWAIVVYVRALQLSQNIAADQLPPELRDKIKDQQ
jgi:mono/diheme cytochrome c family protein